MDCHILDQMGNNRELTNTAFVDAAQRVENEKGAEQNAESEQFAVCGGVAIDRVQTLSVHEEDIVIVFGHVDRNGPDPDSLELILVIK